MTEAKTETPRERQFRMLDAMLEAQIAAVGGLTAKVQRGIADIDPAFFEPKDLIAGCRTAVDLQLRLRQLVDARDDIERRLAQLEGAGEEQPAAAPASPFAGIRLHEAG